MIYRITISIMTGEIRHGVDIYAHPLWPFTMGSSGDPEDDYKVIFVAGPGKETIHPAVYKRAATSRAPLSMPPSYLTEVYTQLFSPPPNAESFTGEYIANIKRCENVRDL